ncbi:MAG: GNAT family N-acetyltransferase [Chloroflexi bacterium]|nr:GNAT family N-acetyltransferase [Chloroflexota bacterium]
MASQVRIEPATPEDVALVLQFIKGLAEYEGLSDAVVATEADLRESLFGPAPSAEAVFAYHVNGGNGGSEPVGFAVFCQHYSTFTGRPSLYLEDIFVLPEWRGHGVGRELMVYGAGLAQARGYPRMEWSVLDWNEPAIRFYKNLGAERVDGWSTYRLSGEALERLGPAD